MTRDARETLSFQDAGVLYARLTGWYVTEAALLEALDDFPHLGVHRYEDPYDLEPDAEWRDSDDGEGFLVEAVDKRRFEYFVKARLALYGTGNPVIIFGQYVAPASGGSQRPNNPGSHGRPLKYA